MALGFQVRNQLYEQQLQGHLSQASLHKQDGWWKGMSSVVHFPFSPNLGDLHMASRNYIKNRSIKKIITVEELSFFIPNSSKKLIWHICSWLNARAKLDL